MAGVGDIIWADGKLILDQHFRVPPTAPGLTQGLGCFETMAASQGQVLFFDRHWKRFQHGIDRLGLRLPDRETIEGGLHELITENAFETEARLRVRLTAFSVDDAGHTCTTLVASVMDTPVSSIEATLLDWQRNEHNAITGIKSTSYAENTLAYREALSNGFDEALLLDSKGNLSEGSRSNVFLVRNGKILTPSLESGCLPGITRGLVLELIDKWNIPLHEGKVASHEIFMAEEVFLTNATLGICPVSRLDDRELRLGPVTETLRKAYQHLVDLEVQRK